MKIISPSKKYNFLIKWGVLFVLLSIVLSIVEQLFVETVSVNENTVLNNFFGNHRSKIQYLFLIIFGIFIAPLYEEVIFRGNFVKNKLIKSISLVGLVIVGSIYSLDNYLIFGCLVIYLLSFFLLKKKRSENRFKTVLVLNAILFSIMHNKITDYENFSVFFHSLQRLGIAFVLLWVTLNYKLIYSMIIHSLWNTTLFSLAFLSLMFPDNLEHKTENENLEVTWKTVNIFNNDRFESKDSLTYIYKTYLLKDVLSTSSIIVGEIDEKTKNKINKFEIEDKTARYNIIIKLKDSSLYKNGNLYLESFLNILEEEKLIKPKSEK